MIRFRALPVLLLALHCHADVLGAGIEQKPGARLPLAVQLAEADGRERTLGEILGDRPALLMFGYYHCRNLCQTSLDALARAMQTAGLGPDDAAVLFLSIDPAEAPATAAASQQAYVRAFPPAQVRRWHFLTGPAPAIAALTQAAGFHYRRDARSGEYVHAAGLVVLAPGGRISSYMPGVAIDPEALKLALSGAAHGRVGALAEQVLVLCSRLGGDGSPRSRAILRLVQGLSLGSLAGLAFLPLLARRGGRGARP